MAITEDYGRMRNSINIQNRVDFFSYDDLTHDNGLSVIMGTRNEEASIDYVMTDYSQTLSNIPIDTT